ncbi:hypothetical protein FACS189468_8660 [Spirochaetia bacterium]|nr:hypothetical protein FACS189468_8660 [Spirochaetia bacterium]
MNSASNQYSYQDNPQYNWRNSYFAVYKKANIKIVMLGDSITQGIQWNELLGRADIANRGIGSDTTRGFLNRMADIIDLNHEFCFVMGGINDIGHTIPVKEIGINIKIIIDQCKYNNITPVVQSCLYVSRQQRNWKK